MTSFRFGSVARLALVLPLGVAAGSGGRALAQSHSATLHTLPSFSALPQTRTNPTKQEAPQTIHTGDWGVFNTLDGSPAGFGPTARYGVSRWAEDWSALKDKKLRDDFFDPLKFIPFNDSKSIYLTLSGESRERNWFETRPFLGQQKPDDSGRMTFRNIIGADLHLGDHLRAYGELINGDAAGWGGYGYNQTYRKRLDVQQLFVEAKAIVAGARSGVMVGRQQFLDAPNYVLYQRETADLPLSWNGGRAYMVWPRFRLDGWDFVQTNTNPNAMFHDNENWNVRLFGAYASYALPNFKVAKQAGQVFFDLFYIGYLLGGSNAAIATATSTQSGSTSRDNWGTRLWGRAGPIEFSLGGLYQGGSFRYPRTNRSRDVEAYAFNSFVGYRLASVYTRPLFGVQTDVYSGGNLHKTTGPVGTYLAPYNPQTNYLDTTTYFAPGNLVNVAPTVEVTPSGHTLLRLRLPILWRENTDDTIYGSSARIYPFLSKWSGGFVGIVPQANFAWRITRHLTWSHDLARYVASRSIMKAGASSGTYYLSTLTFRF